MTTPTFSALPRSYRPAGSVLNNSYAVMLQSHPEAFDCIIYPAKSSASNEILADNSPVGTLLDRDERAQEYDPPLQGRAMIVPSQELDFGATDSGNYESFHSATEALVMLLSEDGLRKHTIIQWLEYLALEGGETVERTVYIADIQPMGRTLGAGMCYVCHPLPALGEVPEAVIEEKADTDPAEEPDSDTENEGGEGDGIEGNKSQQVGVL